MSNEQALDLAGGGEDGRTNQKWRTRNTLVRAAAELVAEGKAPSVAEVADVARVSHATAYRYFSTGDDLLLAATNEGAFMLAVDQLAEKIGDSPDPAVRLDRLVSAFHELVSEHESTLRMLLKLATADPSTGEAVRVRSAYRYRPKWLAQVLEPLEGRIAAAELRRLGLSLSLCMGTEAYIVLRDLHRLEPDEAEKICRHAAQAILAEGLREAGLGAESWSS